ncbi:hypothetical protein FHT87_005918 [Rhizobium sp. BK316]|uniref:hypothetical protein n=1 Tax=Rhizobium sp. BK316 TaxID=2587053 RepID=UPI00160C5D35|nr:hypothetical protein [Rhizobium sp. BK316]MBB3411951.1 hypothetical protein [Rhizobium sp. BK316]
MKRDGVKKAIATVLQTAGELSAVVKSEEAKTDTSRANVEKIASIGEFLVTQKPPLEPNYDNILERGKLMYPLFPARQTLKNYYRKTVAVWRGAYYQIIHLLANELLERALTDNIPKNGGPDSGATIAILRAKVLRLEVELDRHRHETAQMVPQGTLYAKTSWNQPADGFENQIVSMGPIRKWVASWKDPDSLLVEDESGLRLSRVVRPGRLIMDKKTLEAIRAL